MPALEIRLRQLRHQRGASLKKIAAACNVSPQAVHGWINGTLPKSNHIASLAAFFDVSIEWLLHGDGEEEKAELQAELGEIASTMTVRKLKLMIEIAKEIQN